MRGIVIAGTHSGCGKTTVTLGILAALRKTGRTVQPFKAGPDFIDAGLHRHVAGKPSRNLDQWMCGRDYVIDCFEKHSANVDIAVVEGVMGMYDGDFSTANLARLLRVPVILVVDAYGMAESAGAVVRGFSGFGVRSAERGVSSGKLKFAGVIFNRVASESHYSRLTSSVRDVPVLGYLPRELNFEIPHRHLGLAIAEENPLPGEHVDRLADAVIGHIDMDAVIRNSGFSNGRKDHRGGDPDDKDILNFEAQDVEKPPFPEHAPGPDRRRPCGRARFKLAIAYDKAFNFYYEDNLDLLREAGADIILFSPLADPAIPGAADAVYIGGGYPELHTEALSRNGAMLGSIRAWADAGKPLYAECGGLMYLSKGIHDFDGNFFVMAGVFPFETRMMSKPRLGYRAIQINEDCIVGGSGEKCRGHEFHYSEVENGTSGSVYSMHDSRGQILRAEGYRYKGTLASYVHVHFGSSRHIVERFAAFVKGEKIA